MCIEDTSSILIAVVIVFVGQNASVFQLISYVECNNKVCAKWQNKSKANNEQNKTDMKYVVRISLRHTTIS